jgi:N utilization substance protein A
VQAVVSELQGEKIDIIPWSHDPATFVVNALAPAEVTKVVLDDDTGTIEVIVPDDQQSLAIGRRGQNVRLASQLTGWHIDIMTEAAESERRQEEFRRRSQTFIEALNVDDVIAHLLVTEGFTTVEDVAFVPVEEIASIEGFDEDLVEALRERAREYLEHRDTEMDARRRELGVEDSVVEVEGITPTLAVKLGEAGCKTLDDVADLTADELRYISLDAPAQVPVEELNHVKDEQRQRLLDQSTVGEGKVLVTLDNLAYLRPNRVVALISSSPLSAEEADTVIMSARAGWFEDEPEEAPAEAAETTEEEAAQ